MAAGGAVAPIAAPAPISPPARTSSKRDCKARKPPLMGPTRTPTSHDSGPRVAAAAAAATPARSPPPPAHLRKPARRLRLHLPDPGSLIDRMRQHPTVSLFVRPISWTDLHMEVLRVRFVESAVARPSPGPAPPVFLLDGRVGYRADLAPVDEALGALASGSGTDAYWSPGPVRAILRSSFGPVFRNELEHPEMSLAFDSKKYHDTARIPVMWEAAAAGTAASFGSSPTDPAESFLAPASGASSPAATTIGTGPARAGAPVLGYIGRQQIVAMRGRQFRIINGPGDNANEPVRRLSRLRAKMSQPADPDRDPFIVGVLISMAQRHYHAAGRSPPSSQSTAASSSSSPACSGSGAGPGAGVTSGSAASSGDAAGSPGRSGAPSRFEDLTVRVLVDDRAGGRFIVYTAVVTAEFIRQFRHPFRAVKTADSDRAGMTIRYTRVPFGPAAVVTRHLGLALGADLVGELAEEESGGAAADMRERERDPSRKRKRKLERGEIPKVLLLHRSIVREDSPAGEAPASPKRRHCPSSGHDGMADVQQQQRREFVDGGGGWA